MITTTTACLLALLLFPLLLLLWVTESKGQRIRRWRRSGLTWGVCAERLQKHQPNEDAQWIEPQRPAAITADGRAPIKAISNV